MISRTKTHKGNHEDQVKSSLKSYLSSLYLKESAAVFTVVNVLELVFTTETL